MKSSISSYSFSYLMQTENETQISVISKAKEIGFDAIEFTDLVYPEDMTGITLACTKEGEEKSIRYEYKCREAEMEGADSVSAVIPEIETKVSMSTDKKDAKGYVREGYAFSPMFTLGYTTEVSDKEVVSTWLRLEKAD